MLPAGPPIHTPAHTWGGVRTQRRGHGSIGNEGAFLIYTISSVLYFFATIFAVIILVIVLAGSLWVMHNMNENMMPMHEMDQHIEQMKSLQSQQG